MSQRYDEMKRELIRGWKTWHSGSVLAYAHMPDGLGLRLGLKDCQESRLLENALIGQRAEEGVVTPLAHTYDGAYTELRLDWGDNALLVRTATEGGDLLILVTPEKQPFKPSTLIVSGMVLWNREGTVSHSADGLRLTSPQADIPVFMTAEPSGELFAECVTPYLSATLSAEVGISTGRRRGTPEIRAALDREKARWRANKARYGALAECYNAMQTCQAWDTVYNPQADAPITTVSRIWNRSWGGYVLFCWDTYFAALMQSLDARELAYCNAIEITRTLTPKGFVPNFAAPNGSKSYDRSQPPVGSMVCLQLYERYHEEWFLREVYDSLLRWNQWFMEHRLTVNGLLTWGSDPYEPVTGRIYEREDVNNRQGAAYESGLDNSPMYDDTPFDAHTHRFLLDDVGLTGLYIHDCRQLSQIAAILGDGARSEALLERATELENRMEALWDEPTGLYLNRRTDTGALEHRLSPFHFHALFSHRVGQARAERMVAEHLLNPDEFWGEYALPSIARNDPAYPGEYWRGCVWAPMNYLTYMALHEYDLPQARAALADASARLILKEWLREGHVHENYDADTGEGCNSPRSDSFYHWGGLLALIALMEAEGR